MDSDLVSLAQLFLVTISILAVALADARTEPLKTGLSIAGVALSVAWGVCNIELSSNSCPTKVDDNATLSIGHEVLHGLIGDFHD